MPLNLILGRVGCGKTAYIADEIVRRIDRTGGGERITLIVPDQYTVASEDFFLSRLDSEGKKRSRFLNVTSLKSLARNEFAAHGIPAQFIGEGGKTVLMKQAVDDVSPSFRYFPQTYRNPRFLRLLLGAVKELKSAGITTEDMRRIARKENNDKLYDLASVRSVYEERLSAGYFDPDDALSRLCEVLAQSGDFENEAVYVTNFRSFYNRERNVILQLIRNGADVTVSLPTDVIPERSETAASQVTADAAQEARKLVAYCRRMGEEVTVTDLQSRAAFSCEEFRFLEKELAHPDREQYDGVPEKIRLFRGADRFDEVEQVAATIARKVREEGCCYRDFTVIVRSLDDYAGVLDPVFDQYEIPLFYHRRTPLRQRSPLPLITALFSLALDHFSQESMLAFAGSGFCADPADAAQFERYVKVWDVRYNRFRTPFNRPIEGFAEQETEAEAAARQSAEKVRRRVVDVVDRFCEDCKDGTVRSISERLYRVLEELDVAQTLDQHAEEYAAYGERELAARQRKAYEQLILSLDEMVLTAGDDPISLKDYRDLLFAVIDTHDIAILPTSLDEVTAGSPETLPMISPRFVFVLGLNEGVFPRRVEENRLLTDTDRDQLKEFGIGETCDDKILHEMYYLYASLTAPREELYLSYAAVAGGEAAPSSAVTRVMELFPSLRIKRFSPDAACIAERLQRERAAFALHTKMPVKELSFYFSQQPEYAKILAQRMEAAQLSAETTQALYPEKINISPSKADEYHRCRYAYFLKYGLNIRPLRRAELGAAQLGTVIHAALERCISQGLDCDDDVLRERVRRFGEEQLRLYYGQEEPPAPMLRYFNALLKKIERLLVLFRKEFAASEFVPVAFEQNIGKGENAVDAVRIPLEHGSISMIGTADRVDLYERNGKKYLRVVDYKSGGKNFDFDYVSNGLNIQMLMYLYALQQNLYPGQVCVPAGIQYVKVNPTVTKQSRADFDPDSLFEEAVNTARSGVYLKDNGVLFAMDGTEERTYLNIKKPDSSFLITEEKFGQLFAQIRELLKKMGDELHEGKIDKNPIRIPKTNGYESCKYCVLAPYCRHPEMRNVLRQEREEG